MFRDLGGHLIDSDRITHELLEPGQAVHASIVREFGGTILGPGGTIDRRLLGAIVFGDPERRAMLNALIHPVVADRQEAFLDQVSREDPNGVAIVDAALMIETGSYRRYDCVVVVGCGPEEQRRRLATRGLTPDQIRQRLEAQMPFEEKVRYADYVIDNSGSLVATRRRVEEVWAELRVLAGPH
jgi:dephospho-CoA kinase